MTEYNVKSEHAAEFIHDGEIRATLEYAKERCNDKALIEEILKKADEGKGISHREAAVLLEVRDEETRERIYSIARRLKEQIYGNRIVMCAPLYLSNHCVNGCVYCPYHAQNRTIPRRKLTQEEIRREVIALQDLSMLGFQKGASEKALNAIFKENPQISVEEAIRSALKRL